jgi:uncharacterized protein YdeI (YjbR/CyaY-like superfamily)
VKTVKPRFFRTPREFRAWLEKNHASSRDLWVGFHKVHTGKPSLTWPQSVDEALCFGWIDGLRRGLGDDAYMIRFSPRRPDSIWSNVNTKRVGELTKLGLMRDAGHAAFKRRDPERSGIYAMEARNAAFDAATEKTFRRNRAAWKFFQEQPPGYRRIITHWVTSAKREHTRRRRLEDLIALSADGRRVPFTTRYSKPRKS